MAMINCPECGKEISDKAKTCIHCGCPINEERYDIQSNSPNTVVMAEDKKSTGKKKLLISTILSLAGSILICSALIMAFSNATENSLDPDSYFNGPIGMCAVLAVFILPFVFTLLLYLLKPTTKKVMCAISVVSCVVGVIMLIRFNTLNSAALCFAPVFYSPLVLFIVAALLNIIGTKEYFSNDE